MKKNLLIRTASMILSMVLILNFCNFGIVNAVGKEISNEKNLNQLPNLELDDTFLEPTPVLNPRNAQAVQQDEKNLHSISNELYEYKVGADGSSIEIIKYNGPGGIVSIPSSIDNLPVTKIVDGTLKENEPGNGKSAFMGRTDIEKVSLPETLNSLGAWTFAYCSELKSVSLPQSLSNIGYGAFAFCKKLENVVLPRNITTINDETFRECLNLNRVNITENITSIGKWAFYGCNNLDDITLQEGLKSILYGAFADCKKLEGMQLQRGVATIDQFVFFRCGSLKKMMIPQSTNAIADNSFRDCGALTIHSSLGSYAETYAKKNGIPFNVIGITDNTMTKDDQWNFANANYATNLGFYGVSKYPISSNYYQKLVMGLSKSEKKKIDRLSARDWSGSCVGMSSVSILAKIKEIHPENWGAGSGLLKELRYPNKDPKVESLINYYHLSQETNRFDNYLNAASKRKDAEKLPELINMVKEVKNGGTPALIVITWQEWLDTFNPNDAPPIFDVGRHAIVAYEYDEAFHEAFEYEGIVKTIDGKDYSKRIKTYDVNFTGDSLEMIDDAYIYITEDEKEWTIPKYFNTGKKVWIMNKKIAATTNINAIFPNNIEENSALKTTAKALSEKTVLESPMLFTSTPHLKYKITNSQGKFAVIKGLSIEEGDLEVFTDVSKAPSAEGIPSAEEMKENVEVKIILPDMKDTYTITPLEKGESYSYSLNYADSLSEIKTDAMQEVIFDPSGKIALKAEGGSYKMELTLNSELEKLPWYTVSAEGKNANSVSFEQSEKGIFITGDNMKDVTVTANNDSENLKLKYDTDKDKVLIKETDNKLTIATDENDDGNFDEVIAEATDALLGDVDKNKKIEAFDALLVLQIASGKKVGTPEEITAADVNKSGKIEAYDALRSLQFATGKITEF